MQTDYNLYKISWMRRTSNFTTPTKSRSILRLSLNNNKVSKKSYRVS